MKAGNFQVRRLLDDVLAGRIVLPDFQRSFVWKPDDVRELLVSVLGKYYIGSMLYMDEVRDNAPFALRLIEGVERINVKAEVDSIVNILLDGQQRTSSLLYALYAPDLPLSGRKSPFRFFIDIEQYLEGNTEACVVFCTISNKKQISLYSDQSKYISFTQLHDIAALLKKLQAAGLDSDATSKLITMANDFLAYDVQTIQLPRGTSLERVVETFERINKTGQPLSVADLLVAKLFRDNIKLRSMIEEAEESIPALQYVDIDYVLRVVCLLREKEVRRGDILGLRAEEFAPDWAAAAEAMRAAYSRCVDAKNGYGAFDFQRFMPFKTMLIPLSAMIAWLKRCGLENDKNYAKINKWYWITVFLNRYNEAVNTNIYSDFRAMKQWFEDDDKVPNFAKDIQEQYIDLNIDTKSSALYRGIMCLIAKRGAFDYISGQPPQLDPNKVEDDHIFPKSKYFEDTVLNRTIVSSNKKKSDQDPGKFFASIEIINGRDKTISILQSHLIDEACYAALLKNDSVGFMKAREAVIRSEIRTLIT